jgi:hypothetical protein
MTHVRVVSPAAATGQMAGTLATAAAVQNVVVQAGGLAGRTATRSSSMCGTRPPTRCWGRCATSALIAPG